MLDFVTYTQRDFSEQTLKNYAFNIGGDIAELPGGMVGFAAGVEYRDHEGSFLPDPIAERGETAGIPSGRTVGAFDVSEIYGEVNVPIIAGKSGFDYLEANAAVRSSDYSTFGRETTYKVSGLWRPVSELSLRTSFSTGFRAPGIGELFGGAAREDFTFLDPCADYTAILGSSAGGRDTAQPQNIQDNCLSQGVSPGLAQTNPQLSAISAGNVNLTPEESDNYTFGIVWSPSWSEGASWSEGITISLDFYKVEITNAVQGRDPGDLIDACAETNDPTLCALTPRTGSGQLDVVDNQLQNIGGIDASGWDLAVDWMGPDSGIGQFSARVQATGLSEFEERTANPDGSVVTNDRKGQHTDETFARAFPELRLNADLNWSMNRWNAGLRLRWTDEMTTDGGGKLDSVMFADLRATYNPAFFSDSMLITLGFNNVFDEDPPVCFPCGVIGMSTVSHDLPGRVGYLRVTYEMQ
jgi:iron complex outermembrane receptor protein